MSTLWATDCPTQPPMWDTFPAARASSVWLSHLKFTYLITQMNPPQQHWLYGSEQQNPTPILKDKQLEHTCHVQHTLKFQPSKNSPKRVRLPFCPLLPHTASIHFDELEKVQKTCIYICLLNINNLHWNYAKSNIFLFYSHRLSRVSLIEYLN